MIAHRFNWIQLLNTMLLMVQLLLCWEKTKPEIRTKKIHKTQLLRSTKVSNTCSVNTKTSAYIVRIMKSSSRLKASVVLLHIYLLKSDQNVEFWSHLTIKSFVTSYLFFLMLCIKCHMSFYVDLLNGWLLSCYPCLYSRPCQ